MDADVAKTYADVMMAEPPTDLSSAEQAHLEHVFGEVWTRPGLTRRERRFVTLSCVCGETEPDAVNAHMYAALASGDVTVEEMGEYVLHFAVYLGWPKASQAEGGYRMGAMRLAQERGEELKPWPELSPNDLGPTDPEVRLTKGEECFLDINLVPAPGRDSPYFQAGIINYVFGHMWQRPNLGLKERRLSTIPCVGISRAVLPMHSHVGSALGSGDITKPEMDEVIAQYTAYTNPAWGEQLQGIAEVEWARVQSEKASK
jgi:4-carboxymuconolactone decarboxylase